MQAPDLGFQTALDVLGATSTAEIKPAGAEQATELMCPVHTGIASCYHRGGETQLTSWSGTSCEVQ